MFGYFLLFTIGLLVNLVFYYKIAKNKSNPFFEFISSLPKTKLCVYISNEIYMKKYNFLNKILHRFANVICCFCAQQIIYCDF